MPKHSITQSKIFYEVRVILIVKDNLANGTVKLFYCSLPAVKLVNVAKSFCPTTLFPTPVHLNSLAVFAEEALIHAQEPSGI